MRIRVEYTSAIAFVSANSYCWSHDATAAAAATILVEAWRCITATTAYAAIVMIVATVAAAADGTIVERHSNYGAIT